MTDPGATTAPSGGYGFTGAPFEQVVTTKFAGTGAGTGVTTFVPSVADAPSATVWLPAVRLEIVPVTSPVKRPAWVAGVADGTPETLSCAHTKFAVNPLATA